MASSTTITILEARLRLVRIPRQQLEQRMSQILDCWWFRPGTDPFFALCLNQLEVSLFADAQVVRRTWGDYMEDSDAYSSSSSSATSDDDDDQASDADEQEEPSNSEGAELAGTSGLTLGGSEFRERRSRDRERRREQERARKVKSAEEKVSASAPSDSGDESVAVGEDVWVALEIAFHGDGWESAGLRVHALSSPLAESGISILFLSTYQADFILVKESALTSVTAILESRGFRFNAVDDSDEEEAALNESIASLGGLSRRESLRRQGGGGGSPTKTRPRSNGGSLAGSLTLSDRGSVGGSSNKSSTPSVTMSRSASTGRAVAAAVAAAARPSASRQSTLATIDGELNSTSPLDPETTFVTSPTSYPAALPLPPTPRPPPPAFSPVTSLTLLPDELVCVGLAQGEPSETLWRTKIVTALFYPERVLPRPEATAGEAPTRRQRREEWEGNSSTPTGSSSHLFPPRPTPRPPPPSPSTTDHLAGSLPTALTPAPVPFVALTQTADGTSLTADVRLLRALFGEEGSQEEELVYAVGDGGLKGVWAGEEGEGEGEEALPPSEEEDGEEEELLLEGVGVPLPAPFRRTDSGSSAASRSRGRSRGPPVPAGDDLEEEVSEPEEWEVLHREDAEREQRERREKARRAGEGGRRLLKCLQLDLVAFGLDKHGIVEQIAGILGDVGINCLYQSTFSSANILVSKSDIARARRALEEHGRERGARAERGREEGGLA